MELPRNRIPSNEMKEIGVPLAAARTHGRTPSSQTATTGTIKAPMAMTPKAKKNSVFWSIANSLIVGINLSSNTTAKFIK
jgi:hypothetical protein